MSGKRYSTCTCEFCHTIVPRTQAIREILIEESGSSTGESRPRHLTNLKHFFKTQRSSKRTYYKNRKIWICYDCLDQAKNIRMQNKKLEKQINKQFTKGKSSYIIFWSLFWLIVILISIAK
jgi:hypothetical protein